MSQKGAVTKKLSCHLQITEKSTKMTKRPKNSFKQDIILKNIISSAAVLQIRDVYTGFRIRNFPSRIRILIFAHPGSRSRKGTGSRIRIRNTDQLYTGGRGSHVYHSAGVPNPMTSTTETVKSLPEQSGGLSKVRHVSVRPNSRFASR